MRTTDGYAPVTSLRLRENSRTRGRPSAPVSGSRPTSLRTTTRHPSAVRARAWPSLVRGRAGARTQECNREPSPFGVRTLSYVVRTLVGCAERLNAGDTPERYRAILKYAFPMSALEFRSNVLAAYPDVLTPEAVAALEALAPLDAARDEVMRARIARRADRARRPAADRVSRSRQHDRADTASPSRTPATAGSMGSEIPPTCSGSGFRAPARRRGRNAPTATSIRNVAYALLSGADGWMFDGEDALGQVSTMSLDNQRNLKLAIHRDPMFLNVAEQVARRDEPVGARLLRPPTQPIDRRLAAQLDFTTKIFRARGLHLDDRHVRHRRRPRLLGVDRRHGAVRRQQPRAPARGRSVARALPAEDPDGRGSGALERHPRRARAPPRPCRPARSRPTSSSNRSRRASS